MSREATIMNAGEVFDNPWLDLTSDNNGCFEISWKCPGEIGTGFMSRIKLGPGLALGFGNLQVFEDIEFTVEPSRVPVVIHFSGSLHGNLGYSFTDRKSDFPLAESGLGGSIVYRREWQGGFKFSKHEPVRGLIVYIDPLMLNPFMDGRFDCFPTDLCDITCGNYEKNFYRVFTIPPAVQAVISQVFNCPYTGALKRFYLEAKTLEIVTWAMGKLSAGEDRYDNAAALGPKDVERIMGIKKILLGNLEKPPSLSELARISGTNKNKLNSDFRQIFGTSVFDFHRVSRLEYAKDLLESKKMNVTEAAFEVGYSHQQSFTRAFRSHFGTNPTDHLR